MLWKWCWFRNVEQKNEGDWSTLTPNRTVVRMFWDCWMLPNHDINSSLGKMTPYAIKRTYPLHRLTESPPALHTAYSGQNGTQRTQRSTWFLFVPQVANWRSTQQHTGDTAVLHDTSYFKAAFPVGGSDTFTWWRWFPCREQWTVFFCVTCQWWTRYQKHTKKLSVEIVALQVSQASDDVCVKKEKKIA